MRGDRLGYLQQKHVIPGVISSTSHEKKNNQNKKTFLKEWICTAMAESVMTESL